MLTRRTAIRTSIHAAVALAIGATLPLPAAPIAQAPARPLAQPLIIVRWTYADGSTEDLPTLLMSPVARPYACDFGGITAREVV